MPARAGLQLADQALDRGEMVELEGAEKRGVEIVPDEVDVIALKERFLKFAVTGGVARHHAVVRLPRERMHVMVGRRKDKARRQKLRAPRGEAGKIANVRMGFATSGIRAAPSVVRSASAPTERLSWPMA